MAAKDNDNAGSLMNAVDISPQEAEVTWWLYLLACTDGRTYAGVTPDVEARFRSHISGKGAKFTRSNPPLTILGAQAFTSKSAALQAEYALKQLDKTNKLLWAQRWPYGQVHALPGQHVTCG